MANKFLTNINLIAGLEADGQSGTSGQILSSTGTGVEWIDQSATSSESNFVYFDVKNETGSTINKGKGVMAIGTDGNSGHILIDEMVADGSIESKYFLGVLETTVDNGGFARVISFGQLDQFNTLGQNGETWSDGQVLWCDPDSAGDFTITEPDGPNVKIAAAIILNSSTNGKIQVRVQANEGIHDLHDTKITSQIDGDVLVWDNTTGVWFNDSTLNVDYTNSRVGIGTTIPNETLGLYKSDRPYIQLTSSSTGTSSADGSFIGFASSAGFLEIRNKENQDIRLSTNDTERMRITSGGKVGIGTTSPTSLLEISQQLSAAATIDYPYTISSRDDGNSINQVGGEGVGIKFRIAGNDSATPGNSIVGASIAAIREQSGDTDSSTGLGFFISQNNETLDEAVRIDHDGNVGIGTDSPSTTLDVNGIVTATGGNSTQWNTAYDNSITTAAVTGTTTKTLTLTQQDAGTITTSWTDNNTDTNYYTTTATFNTANGVISFSGAGGQPAYSVDLDGRYAYSSDLGNYLPLTGGVLTGNLTGPVFSGNVTASGDGQSNYPFRLGTDYSSYMVAAASNTWGLFWAGTAGARYGTNGLGGPGNIWGNVGNPNEFVFVGSDSTAWTVHGSSGSVWQKGDLWVNGGDIILGGTGRIQGIDSVLTATDATNKAYVDLEIATRTPLNDIRSLGVPAFTNGADPNITTAQVMDEIDSDGGFDSYSSVFKTSWSYAGNYNLTDAGRFTETAGSSWITWTDNSSDTSRGNITTLAIAPNTGGSAGKVFIYNNQGSSYSPGWREVWTSTSDGAGSGLDADLLDGQQGSYYAPTSSIPTNNNQLTNGAGYTTYTANQALNTNSGPTFQNVYVNDWFRNNASGEGMYNQATANHWYSDGPYWNVGSPGTDFGIKLRYGHAGPVSGTLYGESNGSFGLLDNDNQWAVRVQTGTSPLELRCDNNVEFEVYNSYTNSPGSSRAPIFYDSDNTGYYLNPASTSNLNSVTIQGSLDVTDDWIYIDNSKGFNNSGAWTRNQTPYGYIDFGPANSGHAHIYTDRSNFYFNKQIQVNGGSQINPGDMRAPIFYDSNNTGYYLDPSTSGVSLNVRGEITNPSIWINDGDNVNNYNENIRLFNASNGVSVIAFGATGTGGVPTSSVLGYSDRHEVRIGNTWRTRTYGGYFQVNGDARATIFYDSNNTGYYVDPGNSSTSAKFAGNVGIGTTSPGAKLHLYTGGLSGNTGVTDILRIELNRSDHSSTPSGPAILFKDQDTNNSTNEARIKMMTVNAINYGDNDEAASNLLFETTNGGAASDKMIITGRGDVGIGTINPGYTLDVNGSLHSTNINIADGIYHEGDTNTYMQFHSSDQWRVVTGGVERFEVNNSQAYASHSLRAPIFYDSNNTGYYVDPASTSVMNSIVLSGNNVPIISKYPGYKSWVQHTTGNAFIFAPSTAVNGTSWDWSSQIRLNDNGTIQPNGGYKSSDGTNGLTTMFTFVDDYSDTRTLQFKNGLLVSAT